MPQKRWLLALGVAALLAVGGAGIALTIVLPKWVEAKVLSSAQAEGVTLEPKNIAFGWGWVRITETKVSFDRVRSVAAQVGRIDVTLDGLTPTSIELSNVAGQVLGSLTNVGLELSEWTKSHPAAYALPLGAKSVHVAFVEQAGAAPWLDITGGTLTHTASGGVFAAEQARFLGVDLGKVGAGFTREKSGIALGFGESDLGRAPFRVEVSLAPPKPSAKFTLAPTAAERLAKPLGVSLPVRGVTVSAEATLTFGSVTATETIQGTASVTLKGYTPPHPFELDGFIFGDTTTFDGAFTIPPLRDRITLSEAQLKAGAFELRGNGLIVRASDHSQANLTLSGQLPCSALASVEANSRVSKILGSELGAKSGQFADKLLSGSVTIGLTVTADTANLAAAKVERTIGVGCGLHPLTLAELAKLVALPPDVNALLQSLPTLPLDLSNLAALAALPSGLPPLPSGLPALPAGMPQLPPNRGLPVLHPLPTAAPAPTPKPTMTGTGKAPAKPASGGG